MQAAGSGHSGELHGGARAVTPLLACTLNSLLAVSVGGITAPLCREHYKSFGPAGLAGSCFLAGFFIESQLVFVLLWLGLSLAWSVAVVGLAGVFGLWCLFRTFGELRAQPHSGHAFSLPRPRWYEFVAGAVACEKIVFALALIVCTPALFDDPLQNWIGKARALYFGVNWSWDPNNPAFLGMFSAPQYPLGLPLHRVVSAFFSGNWNDVAGRFDGVPLFLAMLAMFWPVLARRTGSRALAAASVVFLCTAPFLVWNMAIGNADLSVLAFATGGALAALSGNGFLAGLLAAGACFMKNDGLALAVPGILTILFLMQPWRADPRRALRQAGLFGLGFAVLAPWLLFKGVNGLGAAPFAVTYGWHADTLQLLFQDVVVSSTHGVFWPLMLLCLLGTAPWSLAARDGRAVFGAWLVCLAAFLFIFGYTNAYRFLLSQETVHRSALQLYGITVLAAGIGLSRIPGRLGVRSRRKSTYEKD